jgi:hypothetical protein
VTRILYCVLVVVAMILVVSVIVNVSLDGLLTDP